MTPGSAFVGRAQPRSELAAAMSRCRAGHGGVVLVAGEAGVGKTRLVREVMAGWDGVVLSGAGVAGSGPYGPLVEVLRAFLREVPGGLSGEPLLAHLGVLLPELGPARGADRATLVEAIRHAFARVAAHRSAAVVLEDLHWADAATLDLLPALATLLEREPLLIVACYRNDGLHRAHPLRRTRTELRRAGRLTELTLSPLTSAETGELLAGLIGSGVSSRLVTAVHERADGLPFFVEELAGALAESDALRPVDGVLDCVPDTELPLPEGVVDAVLLRTSELRQECGTAVELAAVFGVRVDLAALAELVPEGQVDRLLEAGLLVESDAEVAIFRHALVWEALHSALPWARRRSHHQRVADCQAARHAPPEVVAEHRIAAQQHDEARPLLLAAADRYRGAHAYRDAARLARRALAVWPAETDPEGRLAALERLGDCAELCGEAEEAVRVWAEVADLHSGARNLPGVAAARRRIANAYGLLGDWPAAAAAREAAADAYAAAGRPAEAAADRLALAQQLHSAAHNSEALEQAAAAAEAAEQAGRTDLQAPALALLGAVRAALGQTRRGVQLAQAGLELALAEQLAEPAGHAYYELAEALEYAAHYAAAADAYQSAFELCRSRGVPDLAQVCLACMSPVARLMGDWDRSLQICSEVLGSDQIPLLLRRIAEEESGLIAALRGDRRRARGPLRRATDFGHDQGIFGVEVGGLWGLAVVARLEGDERSAVGRVTTLLERCQVKEEWHYALPALRWAAAFGAERHDRDLVAEGHRLLAAMATRDSAPKVLSALAHAGAELALLDSRAEQAAEQFGRSMELMHDITAPYERALTHLRWGRALAQHGEQQAAVEKLTSSYRIARRLRARPLMQSSAAQLAGMGEQVDRRLGRLAARSLQPGGLTRREKEVLRLLALGRTNRQIAHELFVSPRTVDMHVRNLLAKLGCASRLAAARRGAELGLLGPGNTAQGRQNYGDAAHVRQPSAP
jgi:DNA-binding CsgD family transcriptional regulator/tetratricopeptide (TPR) repeat protein